MRFGSTTTPRIEAGSLHVLVDGSLDGVMVVTDDGTIRFANPAAEEIFARDGGLVGEQFGVPLVSADKTEIDVPRRDGTIDVFELRVGATAWQEVPARLVTLRDVTERVRQAEQIRELNRELQLRAEAANVLGHVGDGVVLLDASGIVQLWNPAAERILGVASEQALGRHVTDSVPEWDRAVAEITLAEAPFRDGSPQGHGIVLDVDGAELWLSITGVRFDGGNVFAFHDLTDEVRMDARKKDFIDTASHELRTPLTSIHGAACTLQRADLDLDPAVQAELIDVICTQAERLQKVTEDILTTRRLDDEPTQLNEARFDACHLAAEVR